MASGLTAAAATRAYGAADMIRLGLIGCGGRMRDLASSAQRAGGQILAVCDVYEPRRDEFREKSNNLASPHLDYRTLLDSKDIDAVIIASPNHWHVRMASDAMSAGKDVYLEKPVTHTVEEGAALVQAVRSSNRILQSGMQQRSWVHFQSAAELIQAGNIGRVTRVRTYWFQNYQEHAPKNPIRVELLDWKQWLGSVPDQPFTEEKFRNWRWFWDFGGGAMTDLFTHWIDVVHWAMKSPEPNLAYTMGDRYVFDIWQCPDTIQAVFRYPGFEVSYEGTMVSSVDDGGLEFRGTEATLKIDRDGFTVFREGARNGNPVLNERSFQDGTISHMQNFLDCVRSRKEPNAPVQTGISAALAGQIGNLALHRGSQVKWPQKT
jgi:predicted dehydrogenase